MDLILGLNPGVEVFLYFKISDRLWSVHILLFNWVSSFFLGVKSSECESECEVVHLCPYNTEVKLVDLYLYSPYTPS